jgi:hypothetical protein
MVGHLFSISVYLFFRRRDPASRQFSIASAAINGTVSDEGGAVIPDVRIVLYNVNTGSQRTTSTGPAGVYSLPDVAPGSYSIRALRDGFGTKELTRIVLQVNQTSTLDFTLGVGPVTQVLAVVANLSLLYSY